MCLQIIFNTYWQDLALNNLQGFICHSIQLNQTKCCRFQLSNVNKSTSTDLADSECNNVQNDT